jgi:hypothetical protein
MAVAPTLPDATAFYAQEPAATLPHENVYGLVVSEPTRVLPA